MTDRFVAPAGSRILVASRMGTIATPIATFTGAAAGLFTLPAPIALAINSIPDHCMLCVRAWVKRTGATASADFEAYVGTAGSASDSLIGRVTTNATTGHVGPLFVFGLIGTTLTTFLGSGSVGLQSSSGGTSFVDRSTNFNRAAAMQVTLGMASANAADSFALHGYQVTIE